MKTLELLRALNDREAKDFEVLIKAQKRKGLQNLYAAIKKYRKLNSNPSSEELYTAVFKEPYTNAKSYLLRNELRLLNEIFYDFLIDDTFKTYIKKHKSTYNYWLARSFFNRKLNGAFESDIDRFIAFNKGYIKPEDTALLFDLKSLWLIYTQPKTEKNISAQIEATNQWKEEQIKFLRYRLREVESRQAYLELTLAGITGKSNVEGNDRRTAPQMDVWLGSTGKANKAESYLILKKHSYQTNGLARIEVLKNMLAIEESEDYSNEYNTVTSQLSSLNAIALEYILLGDFVQADAFLLEGIKRSQQHNLPINYATLQNYITNQINLGTYQNGIDYYNMHKGFIEKGRQYISTCLAAVYCYLFLNKADEALVLLPSEGQFTSQQQLTFRMVYLIAFIIRQQYDLAINECQNISRMIKANTGSYFESYGWINTLYYKFLQAAVKPRKMRLEELGAIKNEFAQNSEVGSKLVITEFSLRWLLKQL